MFLPNISIPSYLNSQQENDHSISSIKTPKQWNGRNLFFFFSIPFRPPKQSVSIQQMTWGYKFCVVSSELEFR